MNVREVEKLRTALSALTAMLRTDGYDLTLLRAEAGAVELEILAGPEACAECLVPASMMSLYVQDAIKDLAQWRGATVNLRYPEARP